MSKLKKIKISREHRAQRVRRRLKKETTLPRISVFRSLKHFYAQLITGDTTVVSCSTLEVKPSSGDKKAHAYAIGQELAKRALEKGIQAACLDRGQFLYHGRVQEFARGLRESGLKI